MVIRGQVAVSTIDYLFSSMASSQAQFDSLANNSLSRGIDLYLRKEYERAVRSFKSAAGLSPFSDNAAKAYDYMAKAYLKQNKTGEAIKVYKEAIKIYPTRDNFHLSLGDIYYKNGQGTGAEAEYRQAVNLNPGSIDNRYALGQVYVDTDRLAEAQEQFKKVAALAPGSPIGHYGLGQVARKAGDLNGAIVRLQRAIAVDRRFDNAYLELGYAYVDKGDPEKARRQAEILSYRQSPAFVKLRNYMNQGQLAAIAGAFKGLYV